MKHTRRPAILRVAVSLLLPAILSSTLHAAKAVPWDDLPKKVGKGKLLPDGREDREYTIVTKTGETLRGRTPIFGPSGVNFSAEGPTIPREQVAAIRIRHHISWGAIFEPAVFAAGMLACQAWLGSSYPEVWLLTPVALAVAVVGPPVQAVIESGRRLVPAKVIKVAP
jgi:hypothetical protein